MLMLTAATLGVLSTAQAAPATGFVERSGSDFELDGKPYRFTGINVYNANNSSLCWYSLAGGSLLDDSFTAMGGGAQVIRGWFFQNLATSAGTRDWSGIDHTLDVARARGIRVIATLVNQWPECDGPNGGNGAFKTEAWYSGNYATSVAPGTTVPYRQWVSEIVTRYRDDPAILAWQLVNEAEVKPSAGSGSCSTNAEQTLESFATDVSQLIKSIDANHLVSLGTIGGGQCGAQGAEYQDLHDVATIDFCEYHDYGAPSVPIPGDASNGLQVRINQCNALDKPLVIGELGIDPAAVGGFQGRANAFSAKLSARLQQGVDGELLWAWNAFGSKPDDFDIGPGDPILDVLSGSAVEQFVGASGNPAVDPAFSAATASHVVEQIDFDDDGLVAGQPVTNEYASQGITFVGMEARTGPPFFWHSPPFALQQEKFNTDDFTGNFSYVLSPPAASVGFFWNDDEADTDVTVTTSDGGVREFRIPRPTGAGGNVSTFYGYVSPAEAITRIDFDPQESGLQFTDDMRIGVLPPVNDTTLPTVTVHTPWEGAHYTVGEVVYADWVCADTGGARLASCSGTVGNRQAIDTSTPGIKDFTVVATDTAGNTRTFIRQYTVTRPSSDQPDDRTGSQIHLVYAIPSDGIDRQLDLDGTIAESVGVAQAWLAGQTGGRTLRLDTANGDPDITFFQLSRTDEEIADEGALVRDAIEDELIAAGFDDPNKIYAVHYDGTSTFSCGGGAWPPTLPGTVAALYLHGLPGSPLPCESNPFAGSGDLPGYWEYSWLHEIVHTLGFVADCAPNHTLAGHVAAPTNDLMYAGSDPWDLSDVVLDERGDDYFGHGDSDCLDLAASLFLADVVEQTAPPGGTVTTDPGGDGPSPSDPVEVAITTPTGGAVSIDEGAAPGSSPPGYTLLGQQVVISAPTATAGSPLQLVFTIHPSLIPAGESIQTIQVFRNGVLVGECPGAAAASPDPCVSQRTDLADGTARLTILTSQASTWALAVSGPTLAPSCSEPPPAGAILGTSRGDKITGSAGRDVIFALGGDDSIDSAGGNDVVCGGPGKDKLGLGQGNDVADGGSGADTIDAGSDDDRLAGGDGNDSVLAGPGNDIADGGLGTDTVEGGPGTDTCRGERLKSCER